MFGFRKAINELTPDELAALMLEGKVALVDVREPGEFAAGHIAGAVNYPLSTFDPARLPNDGRRVVLYCAAGGRSGTALGRCRGVRADADTHLAGGIGAWARSSRPVAR